MNADDRKHLQEFGTKIDTLSDTVNQMDTRLSLIEREVTGNGSGVGIIDRLKCLEKRPRARALLVKDFVLVAIPIATLVTKLGGLW